METNTNMMLLLGILFSAILTTVGYLRMKRSKNLAGMSKTKSNFIGLLLSGQASGIGQFVSGILMLIVVIIVYFMQ